MLRCWTTTDKILGLALVAVPIVFLGSTPWLADMPDAVAGLATAAAAIFVMGGALVLSARLDGRMDEVQRAGSRFSSHWGMALGGMAAVICAMLPFVREGLHGVAVRIADGPDDPSGAGVVFLIGVCTAVLLQALASVALAQVWRRRMAMPR